MLSDDPVFAKIHDAPLSSLFNETPPLPATAGLSIIFGPGSALFPHRLSLRRDRAVIELADRARRGDADARAAFSRFGSALGEFLDPWIVRFAPTALVFGGSIARAWDLFADAFHESSHAATRLDRCAPAERLDAAPLLGAAYYASRQ